MSVPTISLLVECALLISIPDFAHSQFLLIPFNNTKTMTDWARSLTAVEAAEKAYAQRMAQILQPDTPPVVIGKNAHNARSGSRRQRNSSGRHVANTSTDSAAASNDTATVEGDEVSTIVQQRPPQYAAPSPAASSHFWNRVPGSAQRHHGGPAGTTGSSA